jgi:hypothetical protein
MFRWRHQPPLNNGVWKVCLGRLAYTGASLEEYGNSVFLSRVDAAMLPVMDRRGGCTGASHFPPLSTPRGTHGCVASDKEVVPAQEQRESLSPVFMLFGEGALRTR